MPRVFISGISGGIGKSVGEVFAEQGWQVSGSDLDVSDLADSTWRTFKGDVTIEDHVSSWFEELDDDGIGLDCLVNIAGINYKAKVDASDLGAWTRVMDVNVLGMVRTIKHAVPLLRGSGSASIVNMSSISARIGSDGYAAYCTSKGAVDSLTRSLALELAPEIRVNAVAPGWVDTDFSTAGLEQYDDPAAARQRVNEMHALSRIGAPEEIGQAIFWLASSNSSFVTGSIVDVDGGYLIRN